MFQIKKSILFVLFLLLLTYLLSLPLFTIHIIILLDFFTSFNSFKSSFSLFYHQKLLEKLKDKNEQNITILYEENITKEIFRIATKDYTFPVVIKGSSKSFEAVTKWNNISWWIENYGDEEVLCKDIRDGIAVASCTIKETLFPKDIQYYIVGDAKIFNRHKDLERMLFTPQLEDLIPGKHVFTQLFMGYGGMGSDVHSALGCNLFRQVVGKKKWWVFPPSQTPYLLPSLNKNGLSVYTMTKLGSGKVGTAPSPWLNKLERYTVTLEPGDIFFDAPWFWHGVENIGSSDDLVIGTAVRYATPRFQASFKNNWILTLIGVASIAKQYGVEKFLSSSESFQESLEKSRNIQANRFRATQENDD